MAREILASASDAPRSRRGRRGEEFGTSRTRLRTAAAGPGGAPRGRGRALRVRAVAERAGARRGSPPAIVGPLGRRAAAPATLSIDHPPWTSSRRDRFASVVFQSAKLASLRPVPRAATGEAGWDCLVAGEVRGARLVSVPRLDPVDPTIRSSPRRTPAVLLVQAADGDEEVSTCGPGVAVSRCATRSRTRPTRVARDRRVPLGHRDPGLVNHARSLESAPGVHFVAQPSNISLNASEGLAAASGGGGGAAAPRAAAAACPRILRRRRRDRSARSAGGGARGVAIAGSSDGVRGALRARHRSSGWVQAPPGAVLPGPCRRLRAVGADQRLNFLRTRRVRADGSERDRGGVRGIAGARASSTVSEAMRALTDTFSATAARGYGAIDGNGGSRGLVCGWALRFHLNADPEDHRVLGAAVAEVWASFTPRARWLRAPPRAWTARRAHGVLAQQMLVPRFLSSPRTPDDQ